MMETMSDNIWQSVVSDQSNTDLLWFLTSYAIGLLVLLLISWRRLFNEHIIAREQTFYKIFSLLPPGDLRGTLTLLQAYALYILLVGGSYTFIAFAGALLMEAAEKLGVAQMVGISLDPEKFRVEDPAWPLFVSLVFIGVLPHFPQIQTVERTFRRWSHRLIGLPPFITELTRNVQRTPLDTTPDLIAMNPRAEVIAQLEDLTRRLAPDYNAADDRRRFERIAVFDHLVLRDMASYPSSRVATRFEPMMRALRRDISDLFDDAEGTVLLLDAVADSPVDDRDPLKNSQARRKLRELLTRIETVERDLSSGLAILVENDPVVPYDASPVLRDFVSDLQSQELARTGFSDRILTILILLTVIVAGLTYLATELKVSPTMSPLGYLGTAIFQTAQMAVLFLPAAMIGLIRQQNRAEEGRWRAWRKIRGTYPVGQYIATFLAAYVPTLLFFLLGYFIFFLSVNTDSDRAVQFFVMLIPVFVWIAIVGGLQGMFSAYASSEIAASDERRRTRLAGLASVSVIVVMVLLYYGFAELLGYRKTDALAANWFSIALTGLVAFVVTYLSAASEPLEPDAADEPAEALA